MEELPKEILTQGANLDLMLTRVWPFPDAYLGRVGSDLQMFTVGTWNRSQTPAPEPGSRTNPVPADLARLGRVYEIYAGEFTTQVVLSQNPARHKQALKAAHAQIRAERLDELLPDNYRDLALEQGLN